MHLRSSFVRQCRLHGFVGQAIGFAVVFATDALDTERPELRDHLLRALAQHLKVLILNFSIHLARQQFRIRADLKPRVVMPQLIIEHCQGALGFGGFIGGVPQTSGKGIQLFLPASRPGQAMPLDGGCRASRRQCKE
jgi:hypothetical protein